MVRRRPISAAAGHAAVLALACLASYWLAIGALSNVHSLSASDDTVGAVWSVIATLFVYHANRRESVAGALSRTSATLVSFVLCLLYLSLFAFHAVGLALLVGLGTFLLMAIGRDRDVGVAGITTAVVMLSAAMNPHAAWEQPILRLVDTALGIVVGLAASFISFRLAVNGST